MAQGRKALPGTLHVRLRNFAGVLPASAGEGKDDDGKGTVGLVGN